LFYLAISWSFAQSSIAQKPTQTDDPQYQVGMIMEVKLHQAGEGDKDPLTRYEVTVRVVNTDYVVLYTPRYGSAVEYKTGMEVPALVGSETLTVRDLLGNTLVAPIISKKTVPAQRVP
jgi:hypothetical protein